MIRVSGNSNDVGAPFYDPCILGEKTRALRANIDGGTDKSASCIGTKLLGGGETISAVVLFADVIGFTRLSNELPSTEVLKTLNRFFAAIDAAVGPNNGEILKFMGDGVLAIFQTPDDLTAQEAAANSALDAVTQARKVLAEEDDGPAVDFRAALHIGDVFFGNIGSGSRLDFTAIGPTVNLASRMLDAASADNAHTVCSDAFLDSAPHSAYRVAGSSGTSAFAGSIRIRSMDGSFLKIRRKPTNSVANFSPAAPAGRAACS